MAIIFYPAHYLHHVSIVYVSAHPSIPSGQYEEAVRMVLDNAPVNSKDVGLKEAASALILRGMSSIRTNQIDAFVGGLNQKQLDTLMKYIYRGFQKPVDITCPALLTWHEKVWKLSSICRVLTDRQVV
ncbi:unnamed protein product [Hydatigera taeniaeformis]|uniref:Actin-related protein 2/3 complex subunit 5 n=1 Tax=Hydatigena taeniaeformis TaxID=6205 RepID=A0A3P7FE47_HYDTA|nr:unnamed protein product [Hydatigera taeniaeformis]